MSILPFILDLAEGVANGGSRDYFDDVFGLGGIYPQDFRRIAWSPRVPAHQRYRKHPYTLLKRGDSRVASKREQQVGKDGFQVSMDVQQFRPNEITVKTVNNTVVVEAKHEEREDEHGVISRQFVRKYNLPKGYDPKEVVSTLSSDGVLTVKAPPPPEKKSQAKERVVHVQQTGPAADSVKENINEEVTASVSNGNEAAESMEN